MKREGIKATVTGVLQFGNGARFEQDVFIEKAQIHHFDNEYGDYGVVLGDPGYKHFIDLVKAGHVLMRDGDDVVGLFMLDCDLVAIMTVEFKQ